MLETQSYRKVISRLTVENFHKLNKHFLLKLNLFVRMDLIISIYGCVFLMGVLSNGSLGIALFTGPGSKNRSPLLLGLVAADFFVCCMAGPVTAASYAISSLTQSWARITTFAQVTIQNSSFYIFFKLNLFFLDLASIGEYSFHDGYINR